MSKKKLLHVVQDELSRVNAEIDRKIVKGLSYRREANRHKVLLSQLRHLHGSTWSRPFKFNLFALFQ